MSVPQLVICVLFLAAFVAFVWLNVRCFVFTPWDDGGYCPKCKKPVKTGMGVVFSGIYTKVCARCGYRCPDRHWGGHVKWPQASFRRRWFRWEIRE